MSTLFKILSIFPLGVLHALGWVLGWLAFLLSGVYRRRFLDNVRQAQLDWRQWLPAVGAAGKLVSELPRLWLGGPVPVQWQGAQYVDAALAHGKGSGLFNAARGVF
jgi:KDO2-lipid IV(A) lauroyltransferase